MCAMVWIKVIGWSFKIRDGEQMKLRCNGHATGSLGTLIVILIRRNE